MPSQLYNNSAVEFICARNFVFNGAEYSLGEEFPQENAGKSLEVLVRTRHLIPVVDDWGNKPRHWFREVRLKSDVVGRLVSEAQGEHLLNKPKQLEAEVPDDIEPGSFNEWDETEDNGDAIHEARINRLEEDVDVARPGKQNVTLVNGKEESEPLALLGQGIEDVDELDVEYKEIDQPETPVSEFQEQLYEGELKAEDVDVAPPTHGEPEDDGDLDFSPSAHTVAQVNEYLANADEAERERVLAAERDGKNRVGIVGAAEEPEGEVQEELPLEEEESDG